MPSTKYANADFVEPSSASSQFRYLKSAPEWNIATFNARYDQWNPHHKTPFPYYQKVILAALSNELKERTEFRSTETIFYVYE